MATFEGEHPVEEELVPSEPESGTPDEILEVPQSEEFEVAAASSAASASSTSNLLSNDDIESLLSSLTSGTEDSDAAPSPMPSAPGEEVVERGWEEPQLEEPATVVAAPDPVEEASEPVEPVAAEASAPEPEPAAVEAAVTHEMLEALVRDARTPAKAPSASAEEAPPPRPPVPARDAEPAPAKRRLIPHIPMQVAASLAIGLFSASCLYLYFVTHPYRSADAELLREQRLKDPVLAIELARGLMESGRYSDGLSELAPVMAHIPPGEQLVEAEFLKTEADYHLLPANAKIPAIKALSGTIDRLLKEAPDHPRALEARRWRADLCRRSDMPEEAYEAYKLVLASPGDTPGLDAVLLDAARTALELDRYSEAIESLRRLIQGYPGSPLRDQSEFTLGEAYLASGEIEAGRMLLTNVARTHPDSELGAQAYARLGTMSYDAGDYDEAIRLFETRLQTATKIEGNDRIYLLLARARRAKGENPEAERVLRELVDFFPESDQVPAALVELSQVLEDLGRREEAVTVVKQAVEQYPDDPEVLANAGRVLAQAGDAAAGAETLLAAENAGAEDPAMLLDAARQWRAAKDLEKAAEAYERVMNDYAATPESVEAAIELARIDVERKRVRAAIERLEALAAAHKNRPTRLSVLDALATLYDDLGLSDRAVEVFTELAASTSDSPVLARAVLALLETGHDEDAWAVANRIDKALLPEPLVYALLLGQGESLLKTEPESGFLQMEEAYHSYPEQRRPGDAQRLLDAALVLDRTASARALVMDLAERADANPAEAPYLEKAAAAWGDYLYRRADYIAAAEAYAIAVGPDNPGAARSSESLWSRLQQANCLLQLEDLQASRPIFEEVAQASSEWGDLAQAKADYVKLELRRRGLPLTPPDEPKQQEG